MIMLIPEFAILAVYLIFIIGSLLPPDHHNKTHDKELGDASNKPLSQAQKKSK
jgi:hypothetical protein